jgi:hypothetical protein
MFELTLYRIGTFFTYPIFLLGSAHAMTIASPSGRAINVMANPYDLACNSLEVATLFISNGLELRLDT